MSRNQPSPEKAGRFGFDPRYAEAIFDLNDERWWRRGWSTHRVLGRPLRIYSYWHLIQLQYVNSPFLAGGPVDVPDLELAVTICRTKWPNWRRARRALERPRGRLRRWGWMLWAERVNLAAEVRKFQDYLADYSSVPKLWPKPGRKGGARRDIDESIEQVTLYKQNTGCPRHEPWTISVGELEWENLCYARRAGAEIKVFTPADEKAYHEQVKRREQTIAKLAAEFAEKENLSPAAAAAKAHKHYWDTVRRNLKRMGA